VLTLTNTYGFI